MSVTVEDKDLVTRNCNRNSYVLYRLNLFPVTLSDANYPKPPHFDILFRLSYIFVARDSNLVGRLTVASVSPRMANYL